MQAKDYIVALGHVEAAIDALQSGWDSHMLNDESCLAYFFLIDARYRLEQAIESAQDVKIVTDSDYNLEF